MHRRRVLALLGTATTLSGCLSNGTDQSGETATPTGTTRETPTETTRRTSTPEPAADLAVGDTYETADGRTLAVSEVRLRRSLLDLHLPDAVQPLYGFDSQFVFLTLSLDHPDALVPDPGSFSLAFDDAIHVGGDSVGGTDIDFQLSMPNDGVHPTPETAVEVDHDRATVGFEVPLHPDTDRVAVEWDGGEEIARWTWDDDLVAALRNPPEFAVTELDFADSFTCGEPFDASVTVENDGGRDGVFAATTRIVEPVYEEHPQSFSVTVPAGGRATWDGTLEYPPVLWDDECTDDTREATFELDWGDGTRRVSVERGS